MNCCNDKKSHTHCHNDNHHHDNNHHHLHEHEEYHDCCKDNKLSQDEKTLKVLLVHWINHNKSHQDNFLEWVEKCKKMQRQEVGNYINKAVEFIEKANEMLIEAKKHM